MARTDAPERAKPWWRRAVVVCPILVVVLLGAMILSTTFVAPGSEAGADTTTSGLDPITYADENFDTAVMAAIEENAKDLPTLVEAIQADPEAAGETYAKRSSDSSPWTYPVTVTGVVAEGKFGEIALEQIEGLPSGVSVGMQIGPAITGTAVRDASGLVGFGDFTNQTDFQAYGNELNAKVKSEVLASFDTNAAIGKTITVLGAFPWSGGDRITITPVQIEVAS